MAPRIIDPTRFLLLGSVVDWRLTYERRTSAARHRSRSPPSAGWTAGGSSSCAG